MYDKADIAIAIAGLTGEALVEKIFELTNASWRDGYKTAQDSSEEDDD